MSDLDRVFTHLDAFLRGDGADHLDILAKVIGRSVDAAKRGYVDTDMEDEELVARIDAADAALKKIAKDPPADIDALCAEFREIAIEVMTVRRATLPLVHATMPWVKVDPREAIFDDDDQYSFAIYDTMADHIATLLPAMQQIAAEVAWPDGEQVVES